MILNTAVFFKTPYKRGVNLRNKLYFEIRQHLLVLEMEFKEYANIAKNLNDLFLSQRWMKSRGKCVGVVGDGEMEERTGQQQRG